MAAQPPRAEQLTLKSLMYLELLVASLLPVTAILLVGVMGTRYIMPEHVEMFTIIFFLAAVLVFSGEFALLMIMQRGIKGHFSDLIAVCQTYLAGHKAIRAVLHDDQDLTAPLAKALNALLDSVGQSVPQPLPPQRMPQPAPPQPLPQWISQPTVAQQAPKKDLVEHGDLVDKLVEQGDSLLKKQLKQLVREVNPAMEADLRVKAAVPTGDIGVVADVCNYLIEELVQNVQWVRQASEQVIVMTREMLNRSIKMAQTIEEQMVQLSTMTETVEKVAAFMQQMGSTLQLSVDIAEEAYSHMHKKTAPLKRASFTDITDRTIPIVESASPMDTHLEQNVQRQVELLGGSLETTQEHATLAESIIGDLYTFAQRLHHSSTDVLDTAERIGSLITLAEQWRNSVAAFQLPEHGSTQYPSVKETASQAMLPSPTSGPSRAASSQRGIHPYNHFSGDRS